MALRVKDIVLKDHGFSVFFTNNTRADARFDVARGKLRILGLSKDQRAALRTFNANHRPSASLDPRLFSEAEGFTSSDHSSVDHTGLPGVPPFPGPIASLSFKSFSLASGNPDTYYLAGYYDFSATDANLSQASTTITHGVADTAYAAHASIVAGGVGSVDTGQVGLRVTGTSITDDGVRTTSDSQELTDDITSTTLNQYLETPKKWIGQITFELFVVSGAPTTYSLDFNYGFTKYEDFNNNDFIVNALECVGRSASNDPSFEIVLYHHNSSGWIYSAAAFEAGGTEISRLSDDHATERELTNNEKFAYKRANLDTLVNGADSEGIVLAVTTTSANAVEYMDAHIGVVDA